MAARRRAASSILGGGLHQRGEEVEFGRHGLRGEPLHAQVTLEDGVARARQRRAAAPASPLLAETSGSWNALFSVSMRYQARL